MRIFLDDVRFPVDDNTDVIIRTYEDFCSFVKRMYSEKTKIEYISFDHDLFPFFESGLDCAKFLVRYEYEHGSVLSKNFTYDVHSQNPEGKINIQNFMANFMENRI